MLMSGCCVDIFPRFHLVSLGEFVSSLSRDPDESTLQSVCRHRELNINTNISNVSVDSTIRNLIEPVNILVVVDTGCSGHLKIATPAAPALRGALR